MKTIEGHALPEAPVVLDYISQDDGTMLYRFAFEGKPYAMTGPEAAKEDFTSWLPEYASKTPRCACCDRVIFPGQPVTVGHVVPSDSGHSHFGPDCNNTAGGFAGSFNQDGELISPFVAA